MIQLGGLDTVKVFKVKGQAKQFTAENDSVRKDDLTGNDTADQAADL